MSGWGSGPDTGPYGQPHGQYGQPYGPPHGQSYVQQAPPRPWQPPAAPPRPPRGRVAFRVALGVAAAGLVAAVAGVLVPVAAGGTGHRTVRESGASMEPTYAPGDEVSVETVAGSALRDGDIAVFDGHDWGIPGLLVKRVIARGGEHVVVSRTGTVTVDGKVREEPYLYRGSSVGISPPVDVVVPAGRLFMMGDHRSDSVDSRHHQDVAAGTIAESAVIGRAADSAGAPGPDLRWAAAGAGVAAAGLVAAAVLGVRNRRGAVPVPPPPFSS